MFNRYFIFSLFYALLIKSSLAQIKLLLTEETSLAYVYQKGDEFNSKTLDQEFWHNGSGGRSVLMSQDLTFLKELVVCNGKEVLLLANKYDTTLKLQDWEVDRDFLKRNNLQIENNLWKVKYATSSIVSKEKFSYGYHEVRFRIQDNQGTWPAFWFYGGNKNEEIDIFEMKGENQMKIHIDVHCPSGCDHGYKKRTLDFPRSYGGWLKISDSLSKGYQVMAVDWRENELTFYLNGRMIAHFKGTLGNKMNVRLNNSVAKDGEGFSPGPGKLNVWPDTFAVDYYRYWTHLNAADTIPLSFAGVLDEPGYGNPNPVGNRGTMVNKRKADGFYGEIQVTRTGKQQIRIDTSPNLSDNIKSVRVLQNEIKAFEKPITLTLSETRFDLEVRDRSGNKQIFHIRAN